MNGFSKGKERLDKFIYRERYDYRRTLIEFAREMSSETDLDRMLASVAERLMQTLNIRHLAFFMEDETGEYRLKLGIGLRDQHGRALTPATPLDLSFLADGIVLLRYFEAAGEVRKAISVLKKRSGRHERSIRSLELDGGRQPHVLLGGEKFLGGGIGEGGPGSQPAGQSGGLEGQDLDRRRLEEAGLPQPARVVPARPTTARVPAAH